MARRSAVEIAKEHQAAAIETAAQRLRAVQENAFGVIPITEREYLARVLALASWDGKDSARLEQLNLELLVGCALVNEDGTPQPLELTPRLAATMNPLSISMAAVRRDTMRKNLQAIIDRRAIEISRWKATPAKHRSVKKLDDYLSRGVVKTGSDEHGHVIAIWKGQTQFGEPKWMYFPFDIGAAIKIAFDLLSDPNRPYVRSLIQCKRPACHGYLLLSPKKPGERGRLPDKHPECQIQWRNVERHK